ncbi:hypothetical protein Tco_1084027 [Tanacetum coccineum]
MDLRKFMARGYVFQMGWPVFIGDKKSRCTGGGKLLDEYEILEAMELALFFFSTLADSIGGFSPNNKTGAGGHPVWPTAIHGHFADAGDSAA